MKALSMVFLVLSALGTAACGSSGGGARAVAAPAAARTFTFAYALKYAGPNGTRSDASGLSEEFLSELRRAGYDMVEVDQDPDATIELRATVTKYTGLATVKLNNTWVGGWSVRARVAVVADGKQLFESETIEFRFTEGEASSEGAEFAPLLAELAGPRGVRSTTDSLASRRRERTLQAEQRAAAEETAWRAEALRPCQLPKAEDDCGALDEWIATNETNVEMAERWLEAGRVRDAAGPKLLAVRDNAAWSNAASAKCEEGANRPSCRGVRAYLTVWPEGSHAAEAKTLLAKADAALAAEEAAEAEGVRREEAAEDARNRQASAAAMVRADEQAGRQRQAQCRQGCGGSCGKILDRAAFESCRQTCLSKCP